MPAGEAHGHIIAESERSATLDGDVVVVVEPDQVRQPKMAGNRGSFVADAFHQVAVPAERVDAVVEKIVAVFIELRGQPALRNGHAYRVPDALTQGAGRGFHSRHEAILGMPRSLRSPLPELLDIIERKIVAGPVSYTHLRAHETVL